MHLKEQSLLKKMLKTSLKLAYKRQHNACSNYAPLERTVVQTWSMTKKQTPHFHLQPARIVQSSPNLVI